MLSSKGSGRIGYLLGTSENLALIFFRLYGKPRPFAIASLAATPPILAVSPAVPAFCASTFPLQPLDGTSKRIGNAVALLSTEREALFD